MASNHPADDFEYELIDLRATRSTTSVKQGPSRPKSLEMGEDDVYNLTRLTRQLTPGVYHQTSTWLVSCRERQTADDPLGIDIGEFLKQSHLSGQDFQTFLRINESIPEPHDKAYSTDEWIELKEERLDWKLDRKVSWALQTLQRDLGSRGDHGALPENTTGFRTWLDSATQIGLKARMTITSPTNAPSLFDSPKYRTSQVLIDQLADLRDGTHDIRTERAARVISDWLDATVVAGDPERRQELKDWPEDRRKVVDAFEAWWAV